METIKLNSKHAGELPSDLAACARHAVGISRAEEEGLLPASPESAGYREKEGTVNWYKAREVLAEGSPASMLLSASIQAAPHSNSRRVVSWRFVTSHMVESHNGLSSGAEQLNPRDEGS